MPLKAEEHLRNDVRTLPNWISLLAALAITMTCFIVGACTSRTHQPILVVYDQQWSRAAGVAALQCVPEIRDSCQKEAREDGANFANTLSIAFKAAPECQGVEFIVDSGLPKPKMALSLHRSDTTYWTLRVDYRPKLTVQVFSLRAGTNAPLVGNGNANDIIKFVCKASKNNGVVMIW
jgi:hypothetical protein